MGGFCRLVDAPGSCSHAVVQVVSEVAVGAVDPVDGFPDPCGDRLPGAFSFVSESPVTPAKPDRGRELGEQRVAFGTGLFGSVRVAVDLRLLNVGVQLGEPSPAVTVADS